MFGKSHKAYLQSMVRLEAERQANKLGVQHLGAEVVRRLRVQTLEPWKRLANGVLSAGFGGFAYACAGLYDNILSVVLWIVAFIFAWIAIWGRKKAVDSLLEGLGPEFLRILEVF